MLRHYTLEYWIAESWYVSRLREVHWVFSQGESPRRTGRERFGSVQVDDIGFEGGLANSSTSRSGEVAIGENRKDLILME